MMRDGCRSRIEAPVTALALLLFACTASAQNSTGSNDSGDLQLSSDALTIVGYILIGAFALGSLSFAGLGFLLGMQWPNPHVCCYTVPYSDGPTRGYACCSVYRLNLMFGVLWVIFFVVSAVSRSVPRLLTCLGFALVHVVVVAFLRSKFSTFGYINRLVVEDVELPTANVLTGMPDQLPSFVVPAGRGGATARGRTSTGIPVYNIPMSSAVVGGPLSDADACTCPACSGACLPAYAYARHDPEGHTQLLAAMARTGTGGEFVLPGTQALASIAVAVPASGGRAEGVAAMPVAPSLLVVEGVPVRSSHSTSQPQRSRSRYYSRQGSDTEAATSALSVDHAGTVELGVQLELRGSRGGSAEGAEAPAMSTSSQRRQQQGIRSERPQQLRERETASRHQSAAHGARDSDVSMVARRQSTERHSG